MTYDKIVAGTFISRPNRFVALVRIGAQETVVHVKNTGRCRELLVEGCRVYLAESDQPKRKTKYDLVAVEKCRVGAPPLLINMDSQAPNEAVAEWIMQSGLFSPNATVQREVQFQNSRFDFCITEGEQRTYLEIKGVTLEADGVASFPDAPTERGVKHLQELMACQRQGYGAMVLFVVQMKGVYLLCPNDQTHPAFGDALRQAAACGVRVLAWDCRVTPSKMTLDQPVAVCLNPM